MKKIVLFIVLVFSIFSLPLGTIFANENEDKLNQLTNQIKEYENEIQKLKSQGITLSNQIAQYNAQIALTTLKISETETQIELLGGRIDLIQTSLGSLNEAFVRRVNRTYKMTRLGEPVTMLLTSNNLDGAVSSFHYLKKIQEADGDLLKRLADAKSTYEVKKLEQENLQNKLEKESKALSSQKAAKANFLSQTKNDEKKFQELLSEAKAQLSALSRFVAGQGGASILSNQTKCDSWGCYYNQRDSQWGNIGLGGSSYSVAEYGCLVTSVSMVASHYGKNIKPIDIAVNSSAFVPGTGYLYHSFNVNGLTVTLTTASKNLLDSELSAGRPVIAGLYSGPDHFIVITKKEGDTYFMNDPFLENGGNRPLTDKYSLGNISSIRLYQFN